MSELDANLRNRATKALVMIAQMYPQQSVAKKLDGSDDFSYETLIRTWILALKGVSDTEIENGVEVLMMGGSRFEPSIPEFRQMCKGSGQAYHKMYTPLPKPKPDKAVAAGHVARLREIIGKQVMPNR